MKILLASWAPFQAGAEVAACRLAVGLREVGHQVTVVLGNDGETFSRMRQAEIDVRHVPLVLTDRRHWWQYARAQRSLRRIIHDVRPDIVHANDLPTSQMVGQTAKKLGIPRLCHHRWIFEPAAANWLNKFGAERHCFVSQALMNALCAASPQLAACPRSVVYDGLPMPVTPSNADRHFARRQLNLPPERAIVLFAGQLIERKGAQHLLQAWRQLPTELAQAVELALVGDDLENGGNYRVYLQNLAAELGIRARFVGFRKDVEQWITASDVCVVPSLVEPLGNATLEAMAHARPVIGSNIGGIPEMIVNQVTGLLVPARNPQRLAAALATLLADAEMRDRFGAAARERCEMHFSLKSHVENIVKEYKKLVPARVAAIA